MKATGIKFQLNELSFNTLFDLISTNKWRKKDGTKIAKRYGQ